MEFLEGSRMTPVLIAFPFLEDVAVHDADRSRAQKLDRTALLEVRERPAHGLDRYAEIVGDVVPRNRQCDLVGIAVGQARRHLEDKGADLLERGDATEDQQLGLQSCKPRICDLANLVSDLRVESASISIRRRG